MKSKAVVATEVGEPFEIMEVEIDGPKTGEVLVQWKVAGLCHSDLHLTSGDLPGTLPLIAGHEGAGVVLDVGAEVHHVKPGDHVVGSFIPACGFCPACSRGMSNLCDSGLNGTTGMMADGRLPFTLPDGRNAGGMCTLGTFSQFTTAEKNSVVKIQDWIPFEVAALVGCGVATGWGSAVYSANTKPGDTVVVFGTGGIGINAIQGAKQAGARFVIAIDPDAKKLEFAKNFGATHTFSSADDAAAEIPGLTWGLMADKAIICIGVAEAEVTEAAFNLVGKRGEVILVSMGAMDNYSVNVPGLFLTQLEKSIKGALFGSANGHFDIPNLLRLWDEGLVKLEDLVTHRFTLDQVPEGYELMEAGGEMLRGIVIHDD